MTQDKWSHSGSRWEPVPRPELSGGSFAPASDLGRPAAVTEADTAPDRRRRGPVLAVLVALLTVGTVSAGVVYGHTNDTPVIDPTIRSSGQPPAARDHRDRGEDGFVGHRGAADGHRFDDHGLDDHGLDDQTVPQPEPSS